MDDDDVEFDEEDVTLLLANPSPVYQSQFDEVYGRGAAAYVLSLAEDPEDTVHTENAQDVGCNEEPAIEAQVLQNESMKAATDKIQTDTAATTMDEKDGPAYLAMLARAREDDFSEFKQQSFLRVTGKDEDGRPVLVFSLADGVDLITRDIDLVSAGNVCAN